VSIFKQTQVYTPEEMQRLQAARRKRAKQRSRFNTLNTIAPPGLIEPDSQGIPGVNDDPGFLAVAKDIGVGALDVLSRPNFAVAGLADELFVKKTGILNALGRVGKELASGIAGIEGEKDTFRDVLDGFDVISEKTLGEQFDALEGVPLVGQFNARGTVGLALDIFLDPLTYLTAGGSAFAKVPTKFRRVVVGGSRRLIGQTDDATQALTRAGVRARQAAETEARTAVAAGKGVFGAEAKRELSDEAHRQAIEEIQDQVTSDLISTGVTAGRSTAISKALTSEVDSILKGGDSAFMNAYLRKMNAKTAAKVRKGLGLLPGESREEIARSVAFRIGEAKNKVLRAGIKGDAPLASLAADIAYKRSMDSVLELAKSTSGLVKDTKLAFDFGVFGRVAVGNLAARVVRSEVGSRTLGALRRTSDLPGVAQAVAAAEYMKDKLDVVGRLLNARWDARKLRGFHILRRSHLDAVAAATRKANDNISRTKLARWYEGVLLSARGTRGKRTREQIFRQFAIALDTGDFSKLSGEMLEAAQEFRTTMQDLVAGDVRRGLMQAKNVRRNYFPHFIDHPERIINKMIQTRPGRSAKTQATIGRFAEQRTFDSIADVEAAALAAGLKDAKMNFDPMVALRTRTNASVEGALAGDFYRAVVQEFGEDVAQLPFTSLRTMMDPLVAPSTAGFRLVQRLVERGTKVTDDMLRRISDTHGEEAAGEYLRQKLLTFTNNSAALKFLAKHGEFAHTLPRVDLNKLAPDAPDGSRLVAMPTHFGKDFQGHYIPASAAESIKQMSVQTARSAELDLLLSGYDAFNNKLKVYLTALFPAFHFRNYYSNVSQNFLDIGIAALNPFQAFRSARLAAMLTDGRKVFKSTPARYLGKNANDTAWVEKSGRVVTFREAAAELRRNNIVREHDEIFEGAGRVKNRPPKGQVPAIGKGRIRLLSRLEKGGTFTGGVIENEGRISLYGALRSRGLSEREATERVNKLLFDYNELTEFERTYIKRVIPFYVWTKKNVALQASAIRSNPGRVINQQKLLRDTDDTPPLMEYEVAGNRIILDRNGKDVRMLSGIDLPIMSIDRLFPLGRVFRFAQTGRVGELRAAYRQVASQMNPFFKVPQEIAANESFFDGRSLDRQTSESIGRFLDSDGPTGRLIPQAFREWLSYDKVTPPSGKPYYTFDGPKFYLMFRTWHISRFMSSSDAAFKRAKRDQSMAMNMFTLATSLKADKVLFEEKQARVFSERLKELEEELLRTGRAGRLERVFKFDSAGGKFRHDRGER
jgi:hypothetical protein